MQDQASEQKQPQNWEMMDQLPEQYQVDLFLGDEEANSEAYEKMIKNFHNKMKASFK